MSITWDVLLRVSVLDDQIESMAKLLKLHHNIGDLAHVAMPVQVSSQEFHATS